MLEPSGNLFRRPQQPKLVGHDARQDHVLDQFAVLRTKRAIPGGAVRFDGPVFRLTAIAFDLATDC
jgi:hypothetical protein